MISRRYVLPLLVVMAVALLPTLRHGYFGYLAAAPRVTQASLPGDLAGVPGASRARAAEWMRSTYEAESWAERSYQVPGQGTVSLFVARGFDLKKLYHHPELGVLRGRSFKPLRGATLPDGGEPVHVLENATGDESAVYALVYDGRWVGNPYALQLSSAFTSLWTGRRPLTLVFAYGDVLRAGQPVPAVADLLRRAVRGLEAAPVGRS